MVTRKTWAEFRDSKMLWFANRMLHIMGWSIVIEFDSDGMCVGAYPARVKFRGFASNCEDEGFIGLSEYMVKNAEELLKESKE